MGEPEQIESLKKQLSEEREKTFYMDNNYQCEKCKCVYTGRDATTYCAGTEEYDSACPYCYIEGGDNDEEMDWETAMMKASEEIIRLRKLYEPKSLELPEEIW